MQFKQMFVTAVCVLFLLKLKWPKSKNFCVETNLEQNPLLRDICSNCLAKFLVGTHIQNTWAQSVRNRRDSASIHLRQIFSLYLSKPFA